jgi:hypothetical protein
MCVLKSPADGVMAKWFDNFFFSSLIQKKKNQKKRIFFFPAVSSVNTLCRPVCVCVNSGSLMSF